jgi:hypothetical protein
MYETTPNLDANKGSMKALKMFTQTMMKEHNYCLANCAYLKGRDNKDDVATWQVMYLWVHIPQA